MLFCEYFFKSFCFLKVLRWLYAFQYNVFDKEGILNIVERTKTFPYMFCAWIGPFLPIVEFSHPDTLAPGLLHNCEYYHVWE